MENNITSHLYNVEDLHDLSAPEQTSEFDCCYCHGDQSVGVIARSMGFRPDVAFLRINKLEEAMQTFIDRVENGSIRSKKTYKQFKDLLNK